MSNLQVIQESYQNTYALLFSVVEIFRSSFSVFLHLLNIFLLLWICVNFCSFIWFFSTWNIYKDIVIVNKSYDIKWNYYVNLNFSSLSPLFHRMLCSDLHSMFCLQFCIQMKVYKTMLKKKKCSYDICGSKIFVFYVFFMQFLRHLHMYMCKIMKEKSYISFYVVIFILFLFYAHLYVLSNDLPSGFHPGNTAVSHLSTCQPHSS